MIMIKDNTVMSKLPISVTAHNGILSQNPQFPMAATNSFGSTVPVMPDRPEAPMIDEMIPCTMENTKSIISIP